MDGSQIGALCGRIARVCCRWPKKYGAASVLRFLTQGLEVLGGHYQAGHLFPQRAAFINHYASMW